MLIDGERCILTTEEAIAMLPDGDTVHTFRQEGMFILGADRDRDEIIQAIKDNEVELAGEVATGLRHGMVLKDSIGPLFIATKDVQKC